VTTRPTAVESAARWAAGAAISAPLLSLVCLTPFAPEANHALFRLWSRTLLKVLGIDLEIEDRSGGSYASPPYLFVLLNQASILEVCYWVQAFPSPFTGLINIEYALLPFVGWATWFHGKGITVVRQWRWQARRAIRTASRRLAAGQTMLISIEGQRSRDGSLSPYKKGPVVMALEARARIVPVVFHGAHDRLPVGEWRVRPGRVKVTLCEPIATDGLGYDDRDHLVERLRQVAEQELCSAAPRRPS
jgi:1-acyl-sn-glycerol-3-phosphate acyltransferase